MEQRHLKRLSASIMLVMVALSHPAVAAPSCEAELAQIAECEQVLPLADIAIQKQSDTITAPDNQNQALQRALETAKPAIEEYSAWYNSKWIWVGVGFVAGVTAHRELSK